MLLELVSLSLDIIVRIAKASAIAKANRQQIQRLGARVRSIAGIARFFLAHVLRILSLFLSLGELIYVL
jgi:hypothetical protein